MSSKRRSWNNLPVEMGKLSSPRISRILGFNQHRDDTYMLSEYVRDSLCGRASAGQTDALSEAMQIARQITEALEDGHEQGLPHLNLQPSNSAQSEGVKLVSYGIRG